MPDQESAENDYSIIERQQRLTDNHDQLLDVFTSNGSIFTHATQEDTVDNILSEGLRCKTITGLCGVASRVGIDTLSPKESMDEKREKMRVMIPHIANSHRRYPRLFILDLPPLTEDQKRKIATLKETVDEIHWTTFFVKKTKKVAVTHGGRSIYDAILPPRYIKGYINLDTGKFIPNPTFDTQSS